MKNIRFLSDKKLLIRQAIAAWFTLFVGVLLFIVSSLLLTLFIGNQERIIIISLLLVVPAIVIIHLFLYSHDYRLKKPIYTAQAEETKANTSSSSSLIAGSPTQPNSDVRPSRDKTETLGTRDWLNFCPNCGSVNSAPRTSYCSSCGTLLTGLRERPLAHPIPMTALVSEVGISPEVAQKTLKTFDILLGQRLFGVVEAIYLDETYRIPHEPIQTVITFGFCVVLLPIVLYVFTGLVAVLTILALLGGFSLILFLTIFASLGKALFNFVLRRSSNPITQVHMIVREVDSSESSIILYGRRLDGLPHTGDVVLVQGYYEKTVLRAAQVRVWQRQNTSTSTIPRTVKGISTFFTPAGIFLAIGIWITAPIVWGVFYIPLLLQTFG